MSDRIASIQEWVQVTPMEEGRIRLSLGDEHKGEEEWFTTLDADAAAMVGQELIKAAMATMGITVKNILVIPDDGNDGVPTETPELAS